MKSQCAIYEKHWLFDYKIHRYLIDEAYAYGNGNKGRYIHWYHMVIRKIDNLGRVHNAFGPAKISKYTLTWCVRGHFVMSIDNKPVFTQGEKDAMEIFKNLVRRGFKADDILTAVEIPLSDCSMLTKLLLKLLLPHKKLLKKLLYYQ